jgi:hypothetical protein
MKRERVRYAKGEKVAVYFLLSGDYLRLNQLSNESDVRNKRYNDTCGTACQRGLTLAE